MSSRSTRADDPPGRGETATLPAGGEGPLRLCVRRGHGEASGPPTLFLHAVGLAGRSWLRLIPELSALGEWAAPDLPGFGESDKPPAAAFDLAWHADRTLELLDALGWERATLIGNSLGGGIALATALRAPERVSALVTLNSIAYPDALPWVGRLGQWPLLPALTGLTPPFLARLSLSLARGRRATVDPEDGPAASRIFRDPAGRRAFYSTLRAIYSRELAEMAARYRDLKQPALVLHGQRDPLIPLRSSERLAAELPGGELDLLADLGHFPQEESPASVAAPLNRFLRNRAQE